VFCHRPMATQRISSVLLGYRLLWVLSVSRSISGHGTGDWGLNRPPSAHDHGATREICVKAAINFWLTTPPPECIQPSASSSDNCLSALKHTDLNVIFKKKSGEIPITILWLFHVEQNSSVHSHNILVRRSTDLLLPQLRKILAKIYKIQSQWMVE